MKECAINAGMGRKIQLALEAEAASLYMGVFVFWLWCLSVEISRLTETACEFVLLETKEYECEKSGKRVSMKHYIQN